MPVNMESHFAPKRFFGCKIFIVFEIWREVSVKYEAKFCVLGCHLFLQLANWHLSQTNSCDLFPSLSILSCLIGSLFLLISLYRTMNTIVSTYSHPNFTNCSFTGSFPFTNVSRFTEQITPINRCTPFSTTDVLALLVARLGSSRGTISELDQIICKKRFCFHSCTCYFLSDVALLCISFLM